METVFASAPGKVILFGEHAVVHGSHAVAASLSDLRIWARVEGRNDGRVRSRAASNDGSDLRNSVQL